jgi:hypothetical protein
MARRRTKATRGLLFISLLLCLSAFAGAPKTAPIKEPPRETLKWGDTEILVERTTTATPDDLQLPFYAGAKFREGYTRRLMTKDGAPLSYLASVTLTSTDKPEKVAQDYSQRLPGKPKPETIQDKSGKRTVLAVALQQEVRTVTIVSTKAGSEIRLTRAIKQADPPPLPESKIVSPGQMGPRRGPGRGPGGGPGRPGRRGGTRV